MSGGDDEQKEEWRWLNTAQLRFICETKPEGVDNDKAWDDLCERVKEFGMVDFYESACGSCGRAASAEVRSAAAELRDTRLAALRAAALDAEENLGEDEVRSALLAIALHAVRTGAGVYPSDTPSVSGVYPSDTSIGSGVYPRDTSSGGTTVSGDTVSGSGSGSGDGPGGGDAVRAVRAKTVALGQKLDLSMLEARAALFASDLAAARAALAEAQGVLATLGDWERRNRVRVYEALVAMASREWSKAADQFLDAMATFTAHEVLEHSDFVFRAVACAVVSLDRPSLKKRVLSAPEVNAAAAQVRPALDLATALHACDYAGYFDALARVAAWLKADKYASAHAKHYTREARVVAYTQYLVSYKSVTLSTMAAAFGVSDEFIEEELARFIAAGRLHAKIDKVKGVVETTRPDNKNAQYQDFLKKGDVLLNRVQKLSRVISF